MTLDSHFSDSPTLDPPGSIVVLGTTPVGIEAALYGRYLGYNVKLLAGLDVWSPQRPDVGTTTERIGPTFQNDWFARHWLSDDPIAARWDEAMPMLPDQCISALAIEAISAQSEDAASVLPITMRQWIEDGLQAVLETDLLRGRCYPKTFVESIELVELNSEENEDNGDLGDFDDDDDEPIPPDFLLTFSGDAIDKSGAHDFRCECIIVADIPIDSLGMSFELPADYFYQIASTGQITAAQELRAGRQQITDIYAQLAGRADLDLYRPRRL